MRSAKLLSVVALAAFIATPALAAQVDVHDAWFRALPGTLPAGGYFTLNNRGAEAVELTGAQSPACGMVMLHRSMETGGMSRMEHVDKVEVPAHGAVAFKPGGYHIMCMQPKPAMKPGGRVAVTLEFADGTKTTATFRVKNARGE